jgi:acetoacetyl-CoA synthetase
MKPLWTPSPQRAAGSELARFMKLAGKSDYEALHRWSVEKPEDFWELVWRFGEVRGEPGVRRLLDAERMPGAKWFPDATLNFAENLLRERSNRDAIVFRGEDRIRRKLSQKNLYDLVSRLSQALADAGVKKGDRPQRCSPPRASAPSGRAARRTSACRACSTASGRSSRRSSSAPTAICTAARSSTARRR